MPHAYLRLIPTPHTYVPECLQTHVAQQQGRVVARDVTRATRRLAEAGFNINRDETHRSFRFFFWRLVHAIQTRV